MDAWAEAEVCVIGGGPSGLAAAIALRCEGFRVAVVDCATPPIDKACGEGLLPESLSALKALGVDIPARVGYPFVGVRFVDAGTCVAANFPNGAAALGLRRTALHQLLVDRALQLGVTLEWGVKSVRLIGKVLSVNGQVITPKLVIGADGQNSRLRRDAGLSRMRQDVRRYGFRRHYRISPWSPYMELHWGKRCQIYVTPISYCEIGVALLSLDPKLRLASALQDFPELMERLASADPSSNEMGALTVSRTLRRVSRDALALVGSVDAITGEGMRLSFRQAIALAKAYKAGDLTRYERAHRDLSRRPTTMATLMLLAAKHGNLRRRAFASLARHPNLFTRLLAIHVG
jgi:menaquinone-9 beta-reductase